QQWAAVAAGRAAGREEWPWLDLQSRRAGDAIEVLQARFQIEVEKVTTGSETEIGNVAIHRPIGRQHRQGVAREATAEQRHVDAVFAAYADVDFHIREWRPATITQADRQRLATQSALDRTTVAVEECDPREASRPVAGAIRARGDINGRAVV